VGFEQSFAVSSGRLRAPLEIQKKDTNYTNMKP
jgi:hypothetical protein